PLPMSSSLLPKSPEFRALTRPVSDVETDLLFVPVFGNDDRLTELGDIDAVVDGEWTRAVASGRFSFKPYCAVTAKVVRGWRATHVCFIGAGDRAEVDDTRWRRVASACGYLARQRRVRTCAWVVRQGSDGGAIA